MRVSRKIISDKEEKNYKKNPECRNCPYFINKLVCPFRRKKAEKGHEPHHSDTRQR